MSNEAPQKMYLYARFERFWHWAQALLVLVLLLTGFEIHGSFTLLGFERAVVVHNFCAWTWLILYAFIIFWMITTGEWRQYMPTYKKVLEVAWFYAFGIFQGKPHPVPKTKRTKHNPLQRLTY
ncbi:MAG: cytochrome b/b6 domain-containing protein, partial [Desulfohalobium sp.]